MLGKLRLIDYTQDGLALAASEYLVCPAALRHELRLDWPASMRDSLTFLQEGIQEVAFGYKVSRVGVDMLTSIKV